MKDLLVLLLKLIDELQALISLVVMISQQEQQTFILIFGIWVRMEP